MPKQPHIEAVSQSNSFNRQSVQSKPIKNSLVSSCEQSVEFAASVTDDSDDKHALISADVALRRAEQLAAIWDARPSVEEPAAAVDERPSAQEVAALKWATAQEAKADELFTKGKFLAAYSAYERAADLLRTIRVEKLSLQAKRFVASLHCKGARAMLCDGKTPGAKTTWACVMAEKALEVEPDNVDALVCRGQARINSGDLQLARADFEAALIISPDHVEARTLLQSTLSAAALSTCEQRSALTLVSIPTGVAEQRCHGFAQSAYTYSSASSRSAHFPEQRPDELVLF